MASTGRSRFALIIGLACAAAVAAVTAFAFAPATDPGTFYIGLSLASVGVGIAAWTLHGFTVSAPVFMSDGRTAWALALTAMSNSIMTVLRRLGGVPKRFVTAPGHSWRTCAST